MNKEDMIKIGIAAFVVIILIVIVVIVMRKKKDNYQYPSGKLYVQPSDARVSFAVSRANSWNPINHN